MPAIAIDWSPSEQDPKYANAGFAQRHGLHPIGLPAARDCLDSQHEVARQQMGTDQPILDNLGVVATTISWIAIRKVRPTSRTQWRLGCGTADPILMHRADL